jgi:hypothetical protein
MRTINDKDTSWSSVKIRLNLVPVRPYQQHGLRHYATRGSLQKIEVSGQISIHSKVGVSMRSHIKNAFSSPYARSAPSIHLPQKKKTRTKAFPISLAFITPSTVHRPLGILFMLWSSRQPCPLLSILSCLMLISTAEVEKRTSTRLCSCAWSESSGHHGT